MTEGNPFFRTFLYRFHFFSIFVPPNFYLFNLFHMLFSICLSAFSTLPPFSKVFSGSFPDLPRQLLPEALRAVPGLLPAGLPRRGGALAAKAAGGVGAELPGASDLAGGSGGFGGLRGRGRRFGRRAEGGLGGRGRFGAVEGGWGRPWLAGDFGWAVQR